MYKGIAPRVASNFDTGSPIAGPVHLIGTTPDDDFRSGGPHSLVTVPMSDKVQLTVGVADMKISDDPNTSIVTYALGSCIGLIAYDPTLKLGGLLHLQLPESQGFSAEVRQNQYKFADTGIAALFDELFAKGAQKNRLVIGVFGGANMLQDEHVFQIGIRNTRATKKILWQHALFIKHEDVGGTSNRTISIELGTGKMTMKKDGVVVEL